VKDLDELRAIMPLPRMLEALGLEESAKKSARSPLRHDKKPSFSVFEFQGRHFWKDHGSTDKGDELDFLKQHYGMDFKQALAKWCELSGKPMEEEKFTKKENFGACFDIEPEGHVELVRGLAEWRGYSESTCRWLIDHRHVGLHEGYICFPILTALSKLKGVHIYSPRKHPKFRILGGKQLPWFIGQTSTPLVHVFESQFDAFALMELAGIEDTSVLITRGASNISKARGYLETLLGKDSKDVAIYIWPQNDVTDDGGQTPAQKWCDGLVDEFQTVYVVDTPNEFEDLNDWLRKGATPSSVGECICSARKVGFRAPSLPSIVNSQVFTSQDMAPPAQVVRGVLHKGCKMVIGGGSKGRKTWSLIHLGIAVACGRTWWGFGTSKGKVLYINFELTDFTAHDRITRIMAAMEVNESSNMDVWNLRGFACDIELLGPQITDAVEDRQYDLIIVDPVYKLLGDKDENNAGEIGKVMNSLEQICKLSGAALAFGHHYAKGDAAAKSSIDRMSGSGVFARDPDAIIALTDHHQKEHFIVEPTLRAFAPVEAFVLRWDFPLMHKVEVEVKFKGDKGSVSPSGFTDKEMMQLLPRDGYTDTEWREAANETCGIGRQVYYKFRKSLGESDKIFRNKEGKYIRL